MPSAIASKPFRFTHYYKGLDVMPRDWSLCATPCDEKLTIAVVVAGGAGNGGCLWGGGPGGAGGSNRSSISVIPLLERGVMVEPECSQQAVPRPNVANAHFGAAAAHLWQHAATESATVWL